LASWYTGPTIAYFVLFFFAARFFVTFAARASASDA